jgi:cobalamin synthase
VIRSGLAGVFFAVLSMAALFAAMGVILFRLWSIAITLGALSVVSMTAALVLARRADPADLQALAARSEPKWIAACGLGLAKLSGGWEPRSEEPDARSDQGESH